MVQREKYFPVCLGEKSIRAQWLTSTSPELLQEIDAQTVRLEVSKYRQRELFLG